jgi:hypothetical protein
MRNGGECHYWSKVEIEAEVEAQIDEEAKAPISH